MRVISIGEIGAAVNLVFEVDLCEFLGKCLCPSGLWGARVFIARITTSPLGAPGLSTRSVNNGLITHLNAALVYRACHLGEFTDNLVHERIESSLRLALIPVQTGCITVTRSLDRHM